MLKNSGAEEMRRFVNELAVKAKKARKKRIEKAKSFEDNAEPMVAFGADGLGGKRSATRTVFKLPYMPPAVRTRYEKKQHMSARILIREDGTLKVKAWFSQGKRLDGDTFCVVFYLLDEDKKVIAKTDLTRGINARLGKGTRLERVRKGYKLPENVVRDILFVRYEFKMIDTAPDRDIAMVLEAAAVVIGYAAGYVDFDIESFRA